MKSVKRIKLHNKETQNDFFRWWYVCLLNIHMNGAGGQFVGKVECSARAIYSLNLHFKSEQ